MKDLLLLRYYFLSYAVAGTTLVDAIATGGMLSTIAAAFGAGTSAYTTYQESKLPESLKTSFLAYAALARRQWKGLHIE